MTTIGSSALRTMWRDQSAWSKTASALKVRISKWRKLGLASLIFGAVLQTTSAQLESGAIPGAALAGYAGAALLAFAVYVQRQKLGGGQIRDWVRARSASEALKQEVYRFLAGVSPYAENNRSSVLQTNGSSILAEVVDLEKYVAKIEVPERDLPRVTDVDSYVSQRVVDQVDSYYKPRARELALQLARLRKAEFVLAAVSALLAAVATKLQGGHWNAWVAVITTAVAAVVAHIEAGRYEYTIMSYQTTARRLEALIDQWADRTPELRTPAAEAEFVAACERTISIENQSWMTVWTHVAPHRETGDNPADDGR